MRNIFTVKVTLPKVIYKTYKRASYFKKLQIKNYAVKVLKFLASFTVKL